MDQSQPPARAQAADLAAALGGSGLGGSRLPDDAAELIALIRELETLKSTICAVQADAAVAYDAARRRAEAAQGVPARRQGRGVAAEVALARRESPHRGQILLGLAKILHAEMPHARQRLAEGALSEFRAMLLARETACLSPEHRAIVDEELCADPAALEGVGTRRLVASAKRIAYEIDPASVVRRASNAASDRKVTVRPAPDTMTYLTGLLPVAQGVAVHAALGRDADALRAQGDARTRGQLMADLLVARITGVELVSDAPSPVPVTINLTMSDATLAGGHAPGLVDAEPVPAEIARLLAAQSLTAGLATWLRRLYTDQTGRLVAMSSKQRMFPEGLSELLSQRDQGICRFPYCDAPIRHSDHVRASSEGGQTEFVNGQGLCEACNHAKQAPGWRQQVVSDLRHTVETITPSGHRYRSTAPAPAGWRRYTLVA